MNVLSPDLLWIDDRCYRLPVIDASGHDDNFRAVEKNWEADNDNIINSEKRCYEDDEVDDNDTCDVEELIETLPDNRFKLSLPIPQAFWSKIIGAKGVTKKRIESDTKTTLLIPRPMEHGDVIIKGNSKRGLILAKKSLDAIVFSARQKLIFTHFISIPMNGQDIKQNFVKFKDQVLELFGKDRGVDESIFQNPDKLHLTIGTLVLTDQNERNLAEKMLNEVYNETIIPLLSSNKACELEIRGIEYMNDDPAEVDVLYAKISTKRDQELLQKIADGLIQHFDRHKLIKSEKNERVKLHVTLMNTLFREEPEETNEEMENLNRNKWNKKTRRTFNAVNILEKFHDFYFGLQQLKSIQLSLRFSTGKDGYYKSSCVLNI